MPSDLDFPPEAAEFGELKADLAVTPGKILVSVGWVLLILGFGTVFLFLAYNAHWMAGLAKNPDPNAEPVFRVILIAAGSTFSILGLFLVWTVLRGRGIRLWVFEKGLVYRFAGKTLVAEWGDIESVWSREHLADAKYGLIHRSFRVKPRNGRQILIADTIWLLPHLILDVGQFATLVELVSQEMRRHWVPKILDSIRAGENVSFGIIQVNQEGLRWKGEMVPWSELEAIQVGIHPAFLVGSFRWALNTTSGKQFKFALQAVPNLPVLWDVIEGFRLQQHRQSKT